ncbi:hypothetical protein [Nocardia cerradoensis]|uniref:hypothetical protein n=1 Tax=Nocardia cerradoensis TaxID=85688 RepID=UPI000B8B7776|nr:hypothetical protein [Nocardia cerradoensis]
MDIVAGIALAVAAILTAAQSVWAIVGPGRDYAAFEYGFNSAVIPFWVCSLAALVGGIMLSVTGAGSIRIRIVAALGGGALFVSIARSIVILCVDSYVRVSASGNWLAIPAAIAILAAVGTLIAGSGAPAPPASRSAIPVYPGAASYPGPVGYPGVPPGYPAPAVAPNYSAPAVYPAAESSVPAPHGRPSYPGAAAPGYPGAPTPAYPGVPGYPGAPSGAQGDPHAAGPHPVAGPQVAAGTPPAQAHHSAPTGSQPSHASVPEQPGGLDSSSAPTVHAGPSGTPPSQPHLPQQ